VSGTDLRSALGLANQTAAGVTAFTLRLTINGADLEVPVTTAQLESSFKTKADKSSSLKFSFRKNRTLSGAFNCNKTTGTMSAKAEAVKIRGVVISEGGNPVIPTGDIEVHMGNAVLTMPFAGLTSTGTGSGSIYQYVANGLSFTLANNVHSFALGVASGNMGLPAAG